MRTHLPRRATRAPALLTAAAVLAALAACGKSKDEKIRIQTAAVGRRDIVVDAQATGAVEPINIVEVKSKASGQITQMSVETGSLVKPGDLLVQVDTRDVQNQYDQALADLRAAEAKQDVSAAQKKRSDGLFGQSIITAQEHEAAVLDFANAQAGVVRAKASLDLAKQRLEDATVRAPVGGTVIEKDVALGQVIASATGTFGGGTTLLKMADLGQVRVRALVNETDIGQVQPGQPVRVTVDAFPDRPFQGTVEKIEPQAVVEQSVTMFPVLVSVSNAERLLMPGMNGEVSVLVDQRRGVVAIPNDAIRNPREVAQVAQMLGVDPDSARAQLQAQGGGMRGGAGRGAGSPNGGTPGAGGTQVFMARGEVVDAPQQGFGGQNLPDVTQKDCDPVVAAFRKHPDVRTKLDALREQMRSGTLDFQAAREQMQALYAGLGVDGQLVRACTMAARNGTVRMDGVAAGANAGQGQPTQGGRGARGGATSAPNGATGADVSVRTGAPERMGRVRSRPGLVFVAENGGYKPRVVRLGASDFDYTEVLSGLKEGDQVVLLAAVAMQAQRQQTQDRMRQGMGGGVPGMQRQGGGAGGGGPRGGGGGR